jgi:hypothetical protein
MSATEKAATANGLSNRIAATASWIVLVAAGSITEVQGFPMMTRSRLSAVIALTTTGLIAVAGLSA